MFRVDAIKRAGGFDANMLALQDWDLYLRILKENKAVYVHEPVAVYYFMQVKEFLLIQKIELLLTNGYIRN